MCSYDFMKNLQNCVKIGIRLKNDFTKKKESFFSWNHMKFIVKTSLERLEMFQSH